MSLNYGNTVQLSQNLSESEFGDDFSIILLFVINLSVRHMMSKNWLRSEMTVSSGTLEYI